jgi:hypothetical protein
MSLTQFLNLAIEPLVLLQKSSDAGISRSAFFRALRKKSVAQTSTAILVGSQHF